MEHHDGFENLEEANTAGPENPEEAHDDRPENLKKGRFLNLGNPPRVIPLPLFLSLLFPPFALWGAFCFSFGMIFVWIFLQPLNFLSDAALTVASEETDSGIITTSRMSPMTYNEQPVYVIEYEFTTPRGVTIRGESASTGNVYHRGERVTIEYLPWGPSISRIKATRKNPFGWIGLITLIFPFIGIMLSLYQVREGLRGARLLKDGALSEAVVRSAEPTGTIINGRAIHKVSFAFKDARSIEHVASYKTQNVAEVTDEKTELVLYDPRDPDDAIPIDGLPGKADIDVRGDWICPDSVTPLFVGGAVFVLYAAHVFVLFRYLAGMPGVFGI